MRHFLVIQWYKMSSHRRLQYFALLSWHVGGCILGSFVVRVPILCLGRSSCLFEKGKIREHKNNTGVKLSNTASISRILETLP